MPSLPEPPRSVSLPWALNPVVAPEPVDLVGGRRSEQEIVAGCAVDRRRDSDRAHEAERHERDDNVPAIRGDLRCLMGLLMGLAFTLRWLLPAGARRRVLDSHTHGVAAR